MSTRLRKERVLMESPWTWLSASLDFLSVNTSDFSLGWKSSTARFCTHIWMTKKRTILETIKWKGGDIRRKSLFHVSNQNISKKLESRHNRVAFYQLIKRKRKFSHLTHCLWKVNIILSSRYQGNKSDVATKNLFIYSLC